MEIVKVFLEIYAFVMWSLIVWCASASIWYDNGLKDQAEKYKKDLDGLLPEKAIIKQEELNLYDVITLSIKETENTLVLFEKLNGLQQCYNLGRCHFILNLAIKHFKNWELEKIKKDIEREIDKRKMGEILKNVK